jgi:hypothetical protein
MKLEIDIDEDYYKIICKRVLDNKPFHSPYEYEVIADGKPLEQEPMLDKIFCIIHPLSIMSTPELEHKAIMQIAEMLEPLCLPESEN